MPNNLKRINKATWRNLKFMTEIGVLVSNLLKEIRKQINRKWLQMTARYTERNMSSVGLGNLEL